MSTVLCWQAIGKLKQFTGRSRTRLSWWPIFGLILLASTLSAEAGFIIHSSATNWRAAAVSEQALAYDSLYPGISGATACSEER